MGVKLQQSAGNEGPIAVRILQVDGLENEMLQFHLDYTIKLLMNC